MPAEIRSMAKPKESTVEHVRAYRQRIRAAGLEQVLFELPPEPRELIDALKERHGLRNRSQALMQLIELGRQAAQLTT
jgi:hypothetical protein